MLSRPRSLLRIVGRMPISTTCMPSSPARRARALDELVELPVHAREAVAGEDLRIAVGLELELAELGRVVAGSRSLLEHLQHAAGGTPVLVDEEHLLLGADAPHAGLEQVLARACARARGCQRASAAMNSRWRSPSSRPSTCLCSLVVTAVTSPSTRRESAAASCARSSSRGATRGPKSRRDSGSLGGRARSRAPTTPRCPRPCPRPRRVR